MKTAVDAVFFEKEFNNMSNVLGVIQNPYDLMEAGKSCIDFQGSREESVLRDNRYGVEILERAYEAGNIEAPYYLGIVYFCDLDGLGQDLEAASNFFQLAYERGKIENPPLSEKSLSALHLVLKTASDQANVCLSENYTRQARSLKGLHSELFAYLTKETQEFRPLACDDTRRRTFVPTTEFVVL